MKKTILLLTIIIFLGACATLNQNKMVTGYINSPKNKSEVDINRAVEKKYINLIPMYGYKVKSQDLINDDEKFINSVLDLCKCSKKEASIQLSEKGWDYFKSGNSEVASKRLNQAYLLDSTNYNIYWGFGAIMGKQNRNDESIYYFEKTFLYKENKNDSIYAFLCIDFCNTLANKYFETTEKKYIDEAFNYIEIAKKIVPKHGGLYSQMSYLYYDLKDYKKALDEYNKAISLDASLVDNNYFMQLTDKLRVKW